jgi:molybdopterin-binding protein
VEGLVLARMAEELAATLPKAQGMRIVGESSRNRFMGLVTKVTRDGVMAQVVIQAGAFRVVSLLSREAANELGLDPGVLAVASVKSTNVVVELPDLGPA